MGLARATLKTARQLAGAPGSLVVQAVGVTILTIAAPEWALVADSRPVTLGAALLTGGVLVEALAAPRYFEAHRRAVAAGKLSATRFGPLALGALSAGAVALFFRITLVLAGLLPGLAMAFVARWLHLPWLRAAAGQVGTVGILLTLLCGSVVTAFATRAAVLEGASPFAALGRSAAVAARAWLGIAVVQSLTLFSTIALLGAVQILPLALIAIAVRWARDLALSILFVAGPVAPGLPPPRSVRRPLAGSRLAPAAVAVLLSAGVVASADTAAADPTSLVGDQATAGAGATPAGSAVGPSTGSDQLVRHGQQVAPTSTADVTEDARLHASFLEANNRMADAEEARDDAQKRLATVTAQLRSGQGTPELAAQRKQLITQVADANRLVDQRRDEVYAIGNQILSKAYGSDYGFLARNWIDMKNTPSFLLGIAESTPQGAVNMVKGVGNLVGRAYDWATGAPSEPTVQPTPADVRQNRLADRQQMLDTELARIQDGAAVNRSEGNWYGENVVGPAVAGEAAGLVVKAGVGVVAARTAAREEAAAQALAREQRLAQARTAMVDQATAGLPRVEGTVSAEALGQGGQYIPFRLADGTEALAFRGESFELRDARAAIDAMNKAQPGVMPKIYGTTRLANGDTALVVERYNGGQVLMQVHDQAIREQALRQVLTPKGLAAYKSWSLGRAFDEDYAFIMPNGQVRLAVPRRADQFRDLVDTGEVFQGTVPRVGPK